MTTAAPSNNSRVGKVPVVIPDGVTVKLDGRDAIVKGPLGELTRTMPSKVDISIDGNQINVAAAAGSGREGKQFQGLARALLAGMVEGTKAGFKVSLDLVGVGYRAELKGQELKMALGLSHPVNYVLPDAIKASIEEINEAGLKKPRVHLTSYDKQLLGQTAARIRSFRPAEPYKGKGVRYTGERIREKAGKTGKK